MDVIPVLTCICMASLNFWHFMHSKQLCGQNKKLC